MTNGQGGHPLDRRILLGATTAALLGVPNISSAQQKSPEPVAAKGNVVIPNAVNPSRIIADFVTGFDLQHAPPLVIDRARVAFVDTVGVMLAGSQLPPADIVCDVIKSEGSAPTATIVGRSLRAAPRLAALANGVSDHTMDFDLTYMAGQSIAAVIPAILPVAETNANTAEEMLAAFIIAAEVAGRIYRAAPKAWRNTGWHSTGVVGSTAAALACARLMKIPVDKIPDVVGITASMASGITANFGTMTKPLHSGHAAQNGVLAAMLAVRGFTAAHFALESGTGYFEDFLHGFEWSADPFGTLGKNFDLAEIGYSIKPYPSGGLGHTAIDAALEMREIVKPDNIAHIDVAITKFALRRITDRYPQTVEAAKFSAPYLAAYTLIHGAPMLDAFRDEALHDEAVRAAAHKVSVSIYQEYADLLEESPAKVTVTLNDGRQIERSRFYPTGSQRAPMTRAQIKAKFDICATQAIDKPTSEKIYTMLSTLGEQPSLADFWPLVGKA
ncbi:MAG: MmgE/PrpD family protein [Xanthobacteraceae bacterium]|jgi:2-methylcitrate dehydratase PrpD